jgi:hypothetical protein
MVRLTDEFVKNHPDKKSLVIIQEPWKYMNYYLTKWKSNVTIHSFQEDIFQSYIGSQQLIKSEDPDFILCGNVPYPHLQLFRNAYPDIIESQKGFTYDFFVLAKSGSNQSSIQEISYSDSLNFSSPMQNWNCNKANVFIDSTSGKSFYHLTADQEYSAGYNGPVKSLMAITFDYLIVDVEVKNVSANAKASLVLSFDKDENQLFWQEKSVSGFIDPSRGSGHLVNAIHFRDFLFMKDDPQFSFYIWNKNHETLDITSMKLIVMKGNPLVYSLIEPLPSQ